MYRITGIIYLLLCKEILFLFSYDALQYENFHHTKITHYTVYNYTNENHQVD